MFGFAGNKSFVKITKRPSQQQKVKTIIKEHYLRDDIWCGSALCTKCQQQETKLTGPEHDESPQMTYLVLDTNVILHQMDLLLVPVQQGGLRNVIIPSTTLQEVQNRSAKIYQQLRDLISQEQRHFYVYVNEHSRATFIEREGNESPNDRNDRAIRVTAKWYQDHLKDVPNLRVLMLTNDKDNKRKAKEMGISVMTVHEYINTLDVPELIDTLAQASADSIDKDDSAVIYPAYLSEQELNEGVKMGKFFQGPLRQNLDNWLEAIVQTNSSTANNKNIIDGEDILIKGRINMNRAIDGDIVVAELLPKEQWEEPSTVFIDEDAPNVDQLDDILSLASKSKDPAHVRPTGRVVGILRKSWRPYCGTLEPTEYKSASGPYYLFVPLNRRVPKIKVKTRQPERLLNQRIMVCIDAWDVRSKFPSGHYIRTLGAVGDRKVESEAILRQHDIRIDEFTTAVRSDLPAPDVPIVPEQHRLDLRDENICSIDPPGCTDIDDALHVKLLPNGNYQVGVHIADVSHYVKEGTHIDKEARERGNTVYLVEKRIDMLPELLGTNLCSLNQHVDRYAFSCLWEMTPDANIVNTSFHKTLIRSRKAMSYGEAQARMDNPNLHDELTESVRNLNKLAKILKQRRLDAGALTLASSEVRFIKDEETHDPIDLELYETKETNSLVEEFMLLANISVAQQITKFYPAFALLRRHPEPRYDAFEVLQATLKKRFNVELDVSSSKRLSETLDHACNQSDDDFFKRLLRMMVTRCMNQARYFSSGSTTPAGFRHYGLAVDIYTHFTSPIRRYADVIVHRLLAASISYQALTPHLNHHDVAKTCDVINRRHRTAELAGRDSTRFHTLVFFKEKKLEPEPAYVMSCAENGFTIVVPRYGLEGKVYISAPGVKNNWGWNSSDKTLISPDGSRQLTSLDRVVVKMQIDYSKPYEPRIVFSSVDPPVGPGAGDAKIGHALPLAPPSPQASSQDDDAENRASVQQNKKKRKIDSTPESKGRKVPKTKE